MKNYSIWQDIKMPDYPKLNKDINVDILIIGGGMSGINLFYALKDNDKKIALVEKNKIGCGITSKSSAKITFLEQDIYSYLTKTYNKKVAKTYYEAKKAAIENILKNIKNEKIACDLSLNDSYLFALNKKDIKKVNEERDILTSFGEKTFNVTVLPNGLKVLNGFYVKNTYVFHPLKYLKNLSQKSLKNNHLIYENTCVIKLEPQNGEYIAYTKENKIKCKTLVLANHYPFFLFPYLFPLKCTLEKSYIMASKSPNLNFNAINISNPIYSIRYHKDYMIYLSGSHNLCFKDNNKESFADLTKNIASDYIWSNHDIMTLDHLPYIGEIKDKLYLATGYNTWGMTGSSLASIVLKDLLEKKENKYAYLFNPKRNLKISSLGNFRKSLFSSGLSYIKSKVYLNKSWYYENPYFTKINGKKAAIYTDENNIKHIVYPKCPHLGCSLIFNKEEKRWECHCHGSIFDVDGHAIIGPSVYDISVNNIS